LILRAYFLVAVLLFASAACGREKSVEQRPQWLPPEVSALAARHGADVDWESRLSKRTTLYTVDLAEQLEGRNIVVVGDIHDVFRRDNRPWIRIGVLSWIDFELACSTELVAPILRDRDQVAEFAVVARIGRVQKLRLKVEGTPAGEDVDLSLALSDRFLAVGDCIEVVQLTPKPVRKR
jgi:hypothetical protein